MKRMVRRVVGIAFLLMLMTLLAAAAADPILFGLEGTFRQETDYTYTVTVTPTSSPNDLSITMPIPQTREFIGHRQVITDLDQMWNLLPDDLQEDVDESGNHWSTATWSSASGEIEFSRSVHCSEETSYSPFLTQSPYPRDLAILPADAMRWLDDDAWQIQADAPEIRELALDLAQGAVTEIEVVGRILGWVQENVRVAWCYQPVEQVDALWTLQNLTGICGNFANLCVALLRAADIPAISAVGLVADSESPDVLHAWIEVYFTDLGWVAFESSKWMPSVGEVPSTILLPQHIGLSRGEERGVSSEPFAEEHSCEFTVVEKPVEITSAEAEVELGQAISWVITLRSPTFYESANYIPGRGYGPYKDYSVVLAVEDIPDGWHASVSQAELLIRKQGDGPSASRSVLLTIVPPDVAPVGSQAVIRLLARNTGYAQLPIVGAFTATVTVTAP